MAQALATSLGVPQLANVFYYGKEFGSKKQELTEEGKLKKEEYKPLSVTQAGVEPDQVVEQLEKDKKKDTDVDRMINAITSEEVSFDDLINILRGR